jgi:hypothetical protein
MELQVLLPVDTLLVVEEVLLDLIILDMLEGPVAADLVMEHQELQILEVVEELGDGLE